MRALTGRTYALKDLVSKLLKVRFVKPGLVFGAVATVFSGVSVYWEAATARVFELWPSTWFAQNIATIPSGAAATMCALLVLAAFGWLWGWRVSERLKPRMRIEALDSPRYHRMDRLNDRFQFRCRVAVLNLSSTERIEGVTVRIVSLDDEYFDAPQTVEPRSQTINAGIEQNWDIAHGRHYASGEDVGLTLNVMQHGAPFPAPGDFMKMTIEASAAGVPREARDFILRYDRHRRPMLIPADEASPEMADPAETL